MRDFQDFVSEFTALLQRAKTLPLGAYPKSARPEVPADALKALFFAPHPDDECITGGIALRLLREAGMDVANVAVNFSPLLNRSMCAMICFLTPS